MKGITELGFEPRSDAGHTQTADPVEVPAEKFYERAKTILDAASIAVETEVLPNLTELQGTWHPLGFMVYHLGVHPREGSLRLHIWPITLRRYVDGTSGAHNHAWHVASKVIAGQYRDERYRVAEHGNLPIGKELPQGWFRVFKPRTPVDGDPLATDGEILRLGSYPEEVAIEAGHHHLLTPEHVHLPTVPPARLAATLVLDSPSFGYPPSILVAGQRGPEPFHTPRPLVSKIEAAAAREQVFLGIAAAKEPAKP